MEDERDAGGSALQPPNAIEFMIEFTQNAQIFGEMLLPVLFGSADLVMAHENGIAALEKSLNDVTEPVQGYDERLKNLEESADAVIRAAEAVKSQGADNPEWQESQRLGDSVGPH
jgi:hypothetical protein